MLKLQKYCIRLEKHRININSKELIITYNKLDFWHSLGNYNTILYSCILSTSSLASF